MVAYFNAPTTERYRVGSENLSESDLDSLHPPTIGEAIGFNSSIFVLARRFLRYVDCVRVIEP